jgi:hypothetical protein
MVILYAVPFHGLDPLSYNSTPPRNTWRAVHFGMSIWTYSGRTERPSMYNTFQMIILMNGRETRRQKAMEMVQSLPQNK